MRHGRRRSQIVHVSVVGPVVLVRIAVGLTDTRIGTPLQTWLYRRRTPDRIVGRVRRRVRRCWRATTEERLYRITWRIPLSHLQFEIQVLTFGYHKMLIKV